MNFSHTFWIGPCLGTRWDLTKKKQMIGNMYYYALSFAYLKQLNQFITLHTDKISYELLKHIPYDKVIFTLDIIPQDTCPCMWACGKMFSLKEAPLGEVFIDGDVFIKNSICLDHLNANEKYDAFFQGKECSEHMFLNTKDSDLSYMQLMCKNNIYWDHNSRMEIYKFPNNIPFYGKYSYNSGVMVFNNQEYKDKFLDAYFYMYEQIQNCKVAKREYERDRSFCPDLICEQRFLYEIGKNYNVGFLLDYDVKDSQGKQTIYQQATDIKFQHIIGPFKYSQIDLCKRILEKINPEIYKSCLKKEQELLQIEI